MKTPFVSLLDRPNTFLKITFILFTIVKEYYYKALQHSLNVNPDIHESTSLENNLRSDLA
jgi:hypothetical protein